MPSAVPVRNLVTGAGQARFERLHGRLVGAVNRPFNSRHLASQPAGVRRHLRQRAARTLITAVRSSELRGLRDCRFVSGVDSAGEPFVVDRRLQVPLMSLSRTALSTMPDLIR